MTARDTTARAGTRVRTSDHRTAGPWSGAARAAVLGSVDAIAIAAAGVVAFFAWAQPIRDQALGVYLPIAPAILVIVLAYAQAGLYPGFGLGPVEVLRRYTLVTATAFLAMAALVLGLKLENVYSRMTLLLAFLLSLIFVGTLRSLTNRLARNWWWWPEPVLLVEGGNLTTGTARKLLNEATEFRAVGRLSLAPDELARESARRKALGVAERHAESGITIAFADLAGDGADSALDELRLLFPRVVILREIETLPVEGVQIRNLDGMLGLEYVNNLLRRQNRWVKRGLDLTLGSLGFLLTLPITGAAMLAVKIISPGSAIFWHQREGPRGRSIRVPKIRTMVMDAEERMEEVLHAEPRLREEWEASFKLKNDPRIIPWVGRSLRRFSVDELPQLWSVIRGDLSLVGPRPFPSYHLDALSLNARRLRDEVRPGITGVWQVAARGDADIKAQQAYDLYYIRNWSIWLDLYILAKTVRAVVSGKGAY